MGETKLCYGCMEPLKTAGPCPNCGYSEDTPFSPDYMKPGTLLHDRYEIGVLLGHNGEGATYLAYDTVICCKVLIREFFPVGLCSRVRNAATISVQYNNLAAYKALMVEFTELNKSLARQRTLSNINPTLDLLAENNTTYAVFEYIEGIKLIDFLKDNAGELTWNQVRSMFPPLFTTLSLIHNASVLHRGISPETIYVTEKGSLLLSAFSISGVRTANTELQAEMFQGYAAPEQYSTAASSRHGTWTDVYGICAVLYRILTGCMPTSADSRMDNDNLCAPHELNSNVPEQVSNTIMEGLNLNASARIQTITDLVTKLFETKHQTERMQLPPQTHSYPEQLAEKAAEHRSAAAEVAAGKPLRQPLQKQTFDAYEDMDETDVVPSAFDRIKIPIIIGVLMLAVIAIIVIALFQVLGDSNKNPIPSNSFSSSNSGDVVPVSSMETTTNAKYDSEMFQLVGFDYESKKKEYKDWFTLVGEEVYNDDYPVGQICEQEVKPGDPFNTGDEIHVQVSKGPAHCVIPDFKNMTLSSYKLELAKVGLTNYKEAVIETENVAAGYVFKTSVAVGETIDLREEYEFTVYYAKAAAVTTAATTTGDATVTTTTAAGGDTPAGETTTADQGGEPMEGDLPGIEQHN